LLGRWASRWSEPPLSQRGQGQGGMKQCLGKRVCCCIAPTLLTEIRCGSPESRKSDPIGSGEELDSWERRVTTDWWTQAMECSGPPVWLRWERRIDDGDASEEGRR
jgi:hypothetical protein